MQFGETALTVAARAGTLEMAELLIRYGARAQHRDEVMRGEGWEGADVGVGGLRDRKGKVLG